MDDPSPKTLRIARRARAAAAVLALAASGCAALRYEDFLALGRIVNATTFPQDDAHLLPPTPFVADLHARLPFVADLHTDRVAFQPADDPDFQILLGRAPGGDPIYEDLWHADVPRLLAGNTALQVFAVFSKGTIDTFAASFEGLGPAGAPITRCDLPGVEGRDGVCLRGDWTRDPNDPRFDDPGTPYAATYGPLDLDRDPILYLDRLQGLPCTFWYDPRTHYLDDPGGCPGFDLGALYRERLVLRAGILRDAAAVDPRLVLVRSTQEIAAFRAARAGGERAVAALLSTEGIYVPATLATPFADLLDPRTRRLRPPEDVDDPGYRALVEGFLDYVDAGFRMMGLTHFLDNDLGGSSTGLGKFGAAAVAEDGPHAADPSPDALALGLDRRALTDAGRVMVRLMMEHGVVADVAHASPLVVSEVAATAAEARVPIVSSHGGLAELAAGSTDGCHIPRNLHDRQILEIAATGGVVGVAYDPTFVCGEEPADVARAIRHVVDVIDAARIRRFFSDDPREPVLRGIDHVALGSDFDGGVATPVDAAHLAKITEALVCEAGPGADPDLLCQGVCREPGCAPALRPLDRPFRFDDGPGGGLAGSSLSKIMGENVARVLDEVLGCDGPPCIAAPATPRRRSRSSGCATVDGATNPYGLATLATLLAALRLTARPVRRRPRQSLD